VTNIFEKVPENKCSDYFAKKTLEYDQKSHKNQNNSTKKLNMSENSYRKLKTGKRAGTTKDRD
jgi:hypothetical protein